MGKEINLWEFRLDTPIEKKIDEFGILSDRIDMVKSELEEMINRYKVMEGEIRPVLEQLSIQNRKSIQAFFSKSSETRLFQLCNYSTC